MSDPEYRSDPPDPRTELTHELVTLQIETWLLEARQADVRLRLQHCRTRRAGLGRAYRRAIRARA
jgi:hypothetical protein